MKTLLLSLLLIFSLSLNAQITSPIIKAGFGVDGDLRANLFNGFIQSGNDDWYLFNASGTGRPVIDTTGAARIKAGYAADVAPFPKRMVSFYRTMSVPQFSVINNRLWLDALFIRDYHGNDTTVFTAGSDKNGMSPQFWSGGVQGIPDKNDILDMYMHVRRAGPARTDSLWMFGGLSLDNVTGNRYFDFEMYQTDIYYDRASQKWYGYGPDEGHTSWEFDAAGNVTKPGDIIFSAEYQSSSLTNIEARIWVNRNSLSVPPASFNWSGQFDGSGTGSQFGYASILPKTAGTFYTGLQCGNNEWAGAFSVILQDNSVATNYIAKQFMEFSVNLTKLGLDPVSVFGGDICGTPFNRMVVKTRASASFTAELKDFVAPIDLFLSPRVNAVAEVPIFCGSIGVSDIKVVNPSASSVYTWTTANGHIIGSTTGTTITVDQPGTYVVMQQLASGCNPYAYDTVQVVFDAACIPMEQSVTSFRGTLKGSIAQLNWITNANSTTAAYEIQRSLDGVKFTTVGTVNTRNPESAGAEYNFRDDVSDAPSVFYHYRLKILLHGGNVSYSRNLRLNVPVKKDELLLFPNPAGVITQLVLTSTRSQEGQLKVYDFAGALVRTGTMALKGGSNSIPLSTAGFKTGTYLVQVTTEDQTLYKKLIVQH